MLFEPPSRSQDFFINRDPNLYIVDIVMIPYLEKINSQASKCSTTKLSESVICSHPIQSVSIFFCPDRKRREQSSANARTHNNEQEWIKPSPVHRFLKQTTKSKNTVVSKFVRHHDSPAEQWAITPLQLNAPAPSSRPRVDIPRFHCMGQV